MNNDSNIGNSNNNTNQPQQAQAQQRPISIQPAQIQQLAQTYKHEIAQARAAGNNTPQGQQHLASAERIKQVLVNYQQQQQHRQRQRQLQLQQAAAAAAQSSNSSVTNSPQIPVQNVPNQSGNVNGNIGANNVPNVNANAIRNQAQMNLAQQNPSVQSSPLLNQQNPNSTPQPQNQFNAASQMNAQIANQAQQLQANQARTAIPQQKPVTIQQWQQIKARLMEFEKKLKIIEQNKRNTQLSPDILNNLGQQEQILRQRYEQYKRAAVLMRQQFQQSQAASQPQGAVQIQGSIGAIPQSSPIMGNTPQPVSQGINASRNGSPALSHQSPAMSPQSQPQVPMSQTVSQDRSRILDQNNLQRQQVPLRNGSQPSAQIPIRNQIPGQQPQAQQHQNLMQQQQLKNQIQNQNANQASLQPRTGTSNTPNTNIPNQQSQNQNQQFNSNNNSQRGTPVPNNTGRSLSPPVTAVNAAARPQQSTANSALSNQAMNPSSIASPNGLGKPNVPSLPIPQTLNLKPQVPIVMKQNRPSLNGGNAISSASLSTPGIGKLPPYELQGDRVVSKRKLSELVANVGADEGDGKTTIDGDVEELLLDLADEFVTSVAGFACRLAKHRKVESIDVKDIQLHLERNWNIRIPGYSSDEIRSVRKWQPTPSYTQKVSGVGISRSVNGNIN